MRVGGGSRHSEREEEEGKVYIGRNTHPSSFSSAFDSFPLSYLPSSLIPFLDPWFDSSIGGPLLVFPSSLLSLRPVSPRP